MTLRTRLTIAFFAISVIPLAAVTLYSYYSSERALRRAAEQQAATMAAELGRRMEWVTTDLERRIDRAWPIPQAPAVPPAQAGSHPASPTAPPRQAAAKPTEPDVTGHVAAVLGDAAAMFESLEFMPGPSGGFPPPPPPPGAGASRSRDARPPAPPGAPATDRLPGHPPAPPAPQGPVAVEMSQVMDKAMEAYKATGTPGQFDMAAWSKAMQERIGQSVGAAAPTDEQIREITARAKAMQQDADRYRAESQRAGQDKARAVTELKGADINTTLRRDGEEVGRIHARLNVPRVFRAILPPSRRNPSELAFAIDSNGEVHARDTDKPILVKLKAAGAIPGEGTNVGSHGDWVIVTRKGPGEMTFGTARPLGDDLRELRGVAVRNFGLGFGFVALVFLVSIPLAGGMTRNLRTLMAGVRAVSEGNLATRVPVKSKDEFGRLAAAFNQMAAALAEHEKLVVHQERLKRELELCRQIQNDMLPREPLRKGLAEVKGVSIPAREVGGDFFNYFVLPGGDIAVLVGDVSGKGVGAALLMANVQATLRARLPLEQDLAKLAAELDEDLHQNTPPEVYLTIFLGIVNPVTRVMRYVNAGHNTQFILRRDSGIAQMASTGRPLGLLPGGGYEERTAELPPGDLLFFYTDGIVEVENEAGEMFGNQQLEAVLLDRQGSGVDDVLTRVEAAVREFRGKAEPSDDATMLALRLGEEAEAV
jgi:serine phosphatase RsbU (regulator of sigma subunit)